VTEKSAEKVSERVDEQRTKVVLAEIEEITKHGIDNKGGDGHIRGVYRWLNKVYDAQVFSYGQRMMFEFVIPEPAAFFLYAQSTDAPKDGPVPKPDPPMSNGKPLSPSHITAFDYVDWVGKYRVLNAPAPPPLLIDVSYFDRQDGLERNNLGRAAKVEIPTGYEAFSATVHFSVIWMGGFTPAFHLVMDGNPSNLDGTNQWGSATLWCGGEKEVSFGYTILNGVSFAIGIDIHCKLTDEGLRKWQQQVFDGVIEAYEQQLAAYNEQQRLAELRQEGRTLGQNPLENRRVEANELKKWVLMILTHDASLARDSFMPGAEPVLNFKTTCKNGSFIRFFENAFEWKNLLYALYPYFWGRKARWSTALHFQDPDPEFAAFLKAGAARVQVPVRPGFEKAVAHFCQYGEIWEGHDPPLRSDKTYVPIVQEIIENLGKLDDGVPYPEDSQPWEVKVPTSLVVLQDLEEIPAITDSLTGDPIALKPGP
jgi:hypothetical protein